MLLREEQEPSPEVPVDRQLVALTPPAATPPSHRPPFGNPVHDVLRITVQLDRAWLLEGFEPGDRSQKLHSIVGGSAKPSRKFLGGSFVSHHDTVATRARIARAGTVGKNRYSLHELLELSLLTRSGGASAR